MFNDNVQTQVIGTLRIFDKDTGTTLVEKRNAIHPGNMAYVIASALSGDPVNVNTNGDTPRINWMAFGNGGSSSTTTISYRSPRISEIYDELPITSSSSTLYSKTYQQVTQNTVYFPGQDMGNGEVVPNRTSKIKFRVEVDHDDYNNMLRIQNPNVSLPTTDSSTDNASVAAFTIDEIGLICGVSEETVVGDETKYNLLEDKSLMVTHVTFHPVLLSANRTIVVDYTITIQIS
jgi:hypothetical protein